jgi:ketosteroid isomerase-like protein
MKKLICAGLLVAMVSIGWAQKTTEPTALEAMVATELAFAQMAKEQGTRHAFAEYIADDGVLFRPTAVKGKEWLAKNPPPKSDKRPLLSWYPAVADMAVAGDMGYTTGPWEFRSDVNDEKAVAFGNFLTVWKRQADGSWKFAIDLGIGNPQPEGVATLVEVHEIHGPKAGGSTTIRKSDRDELLALERGFSAASAKVGAQQAFAAQAGNDVRMFRNNQQPIVGKANAIATLAARPLVWTWEPAFADVSRSGDLGYSYGTYRLTGSEATEKVETGNYYRIWKKEYTVRHGASWRVVADLLDPLPEPTKN